jgi:uncharacterized protein (TIGR02231 family)
MILCVLILSTGAWAKSIEAKGSIEAVTVYRGQALVTRVVEIDGSGGSLELVVTELPARIVPESLFASGEDGVQIRAVRYRSRAVEEEPRKEIRNLDQQIEDVEGKLRRNQVKQKLQTRHEDYLTKLEQFTSAAAKEEMARGMLNADTIKSLTEFLFEKRRALSDETFGRQEEERDLQERLSLLKRRRGELATKFPSTRTAREAIVFLEKGSSGSARVRLNYLVREATWSPMYTLRCEGHREQVGHEYNALVRQMSGEDWQGVHLTLSTASPAMVSEAPILTPFWVTLGAKARVVRAHRGRKEATKRLQRALEQRRQVAEEAEALRQDWAANVAAGELQMMDIAAEREALFAAKVPASMDEALSVDYTLGGKISIPSRSDQQMIQIASLTLPSDLYYLGAPILTPYVYQHADVVNTSELALLSGSNNAYLDGQFMGTGQIPIVAKGQRFSVGFGVDSQLRVNRELADKTERIQGGNRQLTFKYRLLIENYKDEPVLVRLFDRLPEPKGADIRITLGEMTDKLSEDEVYRRTLRQMGILRWDIEVPAKAEGASARKVEYEFKMEFDRNMHISEPSAAEVEAERMEFYEMLLSQ